MSRKNRVIGVCGWSGAGKTTLIARLIPALVAQGLRVSTIKHAHHGFDLDQPGKDSHTHRLAGAAEVIVASPDRWALLHETRTEPPANLPDLLARLAPCDLVIVEGFKQDPIPRIEIHRPALGKPLLQPDDPGIVAVVSDAGLALPVPATVPVLGFGDLPGLVRLVLDRAV